MIPGLGKCPGEGNDNPLQYSCLENPMDREAWWGHKEMPQKGKEGFRLNACPPPNSYIEALTSKVTLLGGGPLGGDEVMVGGALRMGLASL